jgi:hypothetical protein
VEAKTLVDCARRVDMLVVKPAYLLVLKKISESELIGKNTDFHDVLSGFISEEADRLKKNIVEKDWDTAKESAEALKAMFTTISVCYAQIGFGVPSELCDIFEDAMTEFRDKIDSVDRKVAKVFKLAEYRKT